MKQSFIYLIGICVIGIITFGFYIDQRPENMVYANEPLIESEEIIDVGNVVCPVSGKEVTGKNFFVYHGKKYAMCCGMCQMRFLKEPEKYIETLDDDKSPDKTE